MALGQETLTHSRRPRLQNSSSGHAKPLIATRVARFLPVLDKSANRMVMYSGDDKRVLQARNRARNQGVSLPGRYGRYFLVSFDPRPSAQYSGDDKRVLQARNRARNQGVSLPGRY